MVKENLSEERIKELKIWLECHINEYPGTCTGILNYIVELEENNKASWYEIEGVNTNYSSLEAARDAAINEYEYIEYKLLKIIVVEEGRY